MFLVVCVLTIQLINLQGSVKAKQEKHTKNEHIVQKSVQRGFIEIFTNYAFAVPAAPFGRPTRPWRTDLPRRAWRSRYQQGHYYLY